VQLSQVIASWTPAKAQAPSTTESPPAPVRRPRRRRSGRTALEITAVASITVIALWIAIHRVSWLGPALANDLRSVITVIRRSAVAIAAEGSVLYVGISNATTARAMAEGMSHAGGHHVAQLDVNWSFPRIVVFRRNSSGEREAAGLFSGFVFDPNEGLRKPSRRDFFYAVRHGASGNAR
jgi:hypothetical protein